MKRFGIIIFALLLFMGQIFGASAEEAFFEEGFEISGMGEESFFDEEAFGGEEFFAEDVPEDGEEWDMTAEERSVIEIPNEDETETFTDWRAAPTGFRATCIKANTIKFFWSHISPKLDKNQKYYVYELMDDGTGVQVGSTAKKILTIKNVSGGEHWYFVRAEYVDKQNEREKYGQISEIKRVNVSSTLWKKAPKVIAEQTGEHTITLTWTPDVSADYYEVVAYHGKTLYGKVYSESGKVLDTAAAIGKNTYKIRAHNPATGKWGKAAKKVVTISDEPWKAAPIVRDFAQTNDGCGRVYFSHVSPAEKYLITLGKAKVHVTPKLDPETGWYYADVIGLRGKGKQRIIITPQGKNSKGKTVNGQKSDAFPVKLLDGVLLGATDIYAVADGDSVIVRWNCQNPNRTGYMVYLFNEECNPVATGQVSDKTATEARISEIPNGTYRVFVRVLTHDSVLGKDSPLFDTENVEIPRVIVDGYKLEDQKITFPNGTENEEITLYEELDEGIKLETSNIERKIIWKSMDPTIVSVDEDGNITPLKAGTTIITATAGYNTAECKVTVNPVTRRAVVVAQQLPHKINGGFDAGIRFDNDRKYLEKMLNGTGYETVETALDCSISYTQDTIKRVFANADKNDISLVFFASHGVTDNDETYSGALCFTNGEYLTSANLAIMLENNIPDGRVVVFLGSCGSGAAILSNGEVTSSSDTKEWGQQFIDAFVALESSRSANLNLKPRYNELTTLDEDISSKYYYVMVAAQRHTSSYGREVNKTHAYNYFATAIGESTGFERKGKVSVYLVKKGKKYYYKMKKYKGSAATGKWSANIPGDYNEDRKVSFRECYSFLTDYDTVDTPLKYCHSTALDIALFVR